MKQLLILFALACITTGYSQRDINKTNNTTTVKSAQHVPETSRYTRGDKTFVFIPNSNGYNISRGETGTTSTIGKMRKSLREDGYYIMYSTERNESSYGRFDEEGNFKAYRYDPSQDRIIEDQYIKNMSARDDRTRTNRNIQENMNTDEGIETPTTRQRDLNTRP